MSRSPNRFAGLVALVVEDNRNMLRLFARLIRGYGFETVLSAHDGLEALAAMRTAPVDIVICDYNMAPMDGLEYVRLVRRGSASPNPLVPIIMVTAHADLIRIKEARDAGITEILVKPVSNEALFKRIKSVLITPREFIHAGGYVGPDRRRRQNEFAGRERRTLADTSGDNAAREALLHAIDQLAGLYAHALRNPADRDLQVARIAELAADVRARGSDLDSPLIRHIGHSLWAFCECVTTPDDDRLDVVKAHFDALRAVVGDQVAGDGGAMGSTLLDMLRVAAEKFAGATYARLMAPRRLSFNFDRHPASRELSA